MEFFRSPPWNLCACHHFSAVRSVSWTVVMEAHHNSRAAERFLYSFKTAAFMSRAWLINLFYLHICLTDFCSALNNRISCPARCSLFSPLMCDESAKPQNIAGHSWQLKRIFLVCKLPDLELGQIVFRESHFFAKSNLACFLISLVCSMHVRWFSCDILTKAEIK